MQSLYDDILLTTQTHTFTVPNVTIRKPNDSSPKVYPYIVLHEIGNVPFTHGTKNGETHTALGYQLDIHTQDCIDSEDVTLSAFDAGRRLLSEVSDLMDSGYKLTRRFARQAPSPAPDVVLHVWRGDAVLESSGYSYRQK